MRLSNSTSADAFERLPSLSLSRCSRTLLRVPSGRTRGSRKHDSPAGACASTRCASHIGAEKNHLCPVRRYSPSTAGPRGRAGCVCAHVGSALALGHAHADQCRRFLRPPAVCADRSRRRARAAASRRPSAGSRSAHRLQHRHRGVGHRQRTLRAVLDFGVHQIRSRARDLRASARVDPWRAVLALVHRTAPSARAMRDRTRPRRCDCRSGRASAVPEPITIGARRRVRSTRRCPAARPRPKGARPPTTRLRARRHRAERRSIR